jgi:hypothetical protein
MLEGFFDWLWEVLSERVRLWAIVIIALAAAVVVVFAHIYKESTFLEIASEVSKLLLTAIVASVILKVLVLEGYFSTTLSKILYEDKGLQRLTKEERQDAWRKLTVLVYAPFLSRNVRSKDNVEISTLSDNLFKSVTLSFNFNENYYNKGWQRTYEIQWDNGREYTRLVMTETFRAKMIPFKPTEDVNWVTTRIAEAYLGVGDYENSEIGIEINGYPPDPNACTCKTVGDREIRTYKLYGNTKYDVYRRRVLK